MQKITFENALGESLEASRSFPYFLETLSGTGAIAPSVLMQKRFQQDGRDYYGSLLEPRMMKVTLFVKGDNRSDLMVKRQKLMEVFNPKLGLGKLTYQNDIGTWEIKALVQSSPTSDEAMIRNTFVQYFTLQLLCPDPAWENPVKQSAKLVGFDGGLTVPMTLPMITGKQGVTRELMYNGTLDAPITIEFRGPAVMPKIIREETGEQIEVELAIESGESLFIVTNPNDYEVYKVLAGGEKESAFNYVAADSKYFSLTKGSNTLSFSAAGGAPEAYIHWKDRYVGV